MAGRPTVQYVLQLGVIDRDDQQMVLVYHLLFSLLSIGTGIAGDKKPHATVRIHAEKNKAHGKNLEIEFGLIRRERVSSLIKGSKYLTECCVVDESKLAILVILRSTGFRLFDSSRNSSIFQSLVQITKSGDFSNI